jgi:hypothetical protein
LFYFCWYIFNLHVSFFLHCFVEEEEWDWEYTTLNQNIIVIWFLLLHYQIKENNSDSKNIMKIWRCYIHLFYISFINDVYDQS